MDNKQEQRDEIQRKIRELERELAEIDLQDKPLGDWNTEREEQLQKEIDSLRLELNVVANTTTAKTRQAKARNLQANSRQSP